MAHHSSQEDLVALQEAEDLLKTLQTEWLETLDDLAQEKEEIKNGDLFATIEYLTFCDHLSKDIAIDIRDLDSQLNDLLELRARLAQSKQHVEMINSIIQEMKELKTHQQQKLQKIDEEYPMLAETALRQSEDLVSKFISEINTEKKVPNLNTQINQNLEKELFLQEIRDTLESYREAREELISELTIGSSSQQLPEGTLSEDLGEDKPEIDSILSQLDTLITSCDTALLIKDIQD